MILAIKTDNPTAELVLIDGSGEVLEHETWLAERRLALELLGRLEALLKRHQATWEDLTGLIVYMGPGSFTGLRIGITVMNTIAYSSSIPIVGQTGDDWYGRGIERLRASENDHIVMPEYGAPARITRPRK